MIGADLNSHDPLDDSGVRPSIDRLLKKRLSMYEMNKITSIKQCNSVAEDLITDEVNDRHDHALDKPASDDDDDFSFLDIETEQEIPLADINYRSRPCSFLTAATTDNNQLTSSSKEAAYSNDDEINARPVKRSIRKCKSMSELKSSLGTNGGHIP